MHSIDLCACVPARGQASYMGHNYMGHNYMGQNCMGHNYMGHNYMGRNYIGHNYMGQNYMCLHGVERAIWVITIWAITI